MSKLIIAGGSGFLGTSLSSALREKFKEIVILGRQKSSGQPHVKHVHWDGITMGEWCKELEGATAVINLCGKSVDCRYNKKNMAEIFASRLDSTSVIGNAILKCRRPPSVWINGASATIYRHSEEKPMTEKDGEIGTGFSVEVCKAWEKTFYDFRLPATRQVNFRITMVMGRNGGVLPVLTGLAGKGLGGKMGSGRQMVSWIHINDFCRITAWAIENESASGTYNVAAPNPLPNAVMMKTIRAKLKVPFGLPAPRPVLEVGAFFLRTETELVLKSRYVVPQRLLESGYKFEVSTFDAIPDLQ